VAWSEILSCVVFFSWAVSSDFFCCYMYFADFLCFFPLPVAGFMSVGCLEHVGRMFGISSILVLVWCAMVHVFGIVEFSKEVGLAFWH